MVTKRKKVTKRKTIKPKKWIVKDNFGVTWGRNLTKKGADSLAKKLKRDWKLKKKMFK